MLFTLSVFFGFFFRWLVEILNGTVPPEWLGLDAISAVATYRIFYGIKDLVGSPHFPSVR